MTITIQMPVPMTPFLAARAVFESDPKAVEGRPLRLDEPRTRRAPGAVSNRLRANPVWNAATDAPLSVHHQMRDQAWSAVIDEMRGRAAPPRVLAPPCRANPLRPSAVLPMRPVPPVSDHVPTPGNRLYPSLSMESLFQRYPELARFEDAGMPAARVGTPDFEGGHAQTKATGFTYSPGLSKAKVRRSAFHGLHKLCPG